MSGVPEPAPGQHPHVDLPASCDGARLLGVHRFDHAIAAWEVHVGRRAEHTRETDAASKAASLEGADVLTRAELKSHVLAESARLLLSSQAPESVVQAIAEKVMELLDCQAFFNYILEEGAGRLRLNAFAGVPESTADSIATLELGSAVCGCVGRDGCRIVVEDVQHADDPRADLIRSLGMRAYACHPLIYQGETIGTLSFGTTTREAFTKEDLELMQVVSDQAAAAMARSRAERAVRQSREDLNRAQAVARVGSWRLDTRENVLTWSDEAYRIFGIPLGTPLTYEVFLESVHPEDREYVDSRWAAAVTGAPYDIEHRIVAGDEVRWVHEHAELEFDAGGELLGGFGTVQDITERKAAEREKQEEARRIAAANRLLELFVQEADLRLYDKALDVLLGETGSEFGVLGYMDEDGDLVCPTMSRIFEECEMTDADKCIVYKRHKWTGLWGRAIQEKSALVNNELADVPAGHMPIYSNLAVAIVFQDKTIGLINLANKPGGYLEEDAEFVSAIAENIAPVLYAWIQRRLREIERERTIAETEERHLLNEALNDIAVAMTASLDENEIMRCLAFDVPSVLGAEAAIVGRREADGWRITTCAGISGLEPGQHVTDAQVAVEMPPLNDFRPAAIDDIVTVPGLPGGVIGALGIQSMLVLPLVVSGEAYGAALYVSTAEKSAFTAVQAEFGTKLMNVVTVALESARLYRREHRIAETLQQAVLGAPEQFDGVESAYLYRAASKAAAVGGDFFDIFEIDPGVIGVVVGDVSGKGLEAARLTTLVRDGVRAHALENSDPAWVVRSVNRLVFRSSPLGMFATLFFGVLDLSTRRLTHCSAGHPSPIVVSDGDVTQLSGQCSSIVGAFEDAPFGSDIARLPEGATLVLYTDGLTEARRDGEFFGEQRVLSTLESLTSAPVDQYPTRLLDSALEFTGSTLLDDVVVVALRVTG